MLGRRTRFLLLLTAVLFAGASFAQTMGLMAPNAVPTLGKIERLDPAFDKLVDPNAVIELLAEKKFE